MQETIKDCLTQTTEVLVGCGAKGTFLAPDTKEGMPTDELNISNPEAVRQASILYVEAGTQVLQTNTFRANKLALADYGLKHRTYEINFQGAQIARSAIDKHQVYIAGDIGPSGKFLPPTGTCSAQEMQDSFTEQVKGLVDGGVDLIHIETMSCLDEVKEAIAAVRQVSLTIPIMVTMTFEEKKGRFHTMMGVTPGNLVTLYDEFSLLACGPNCGMGPEGADRLVQQMLAVNRNAIIITKLNAGKPILVEGKEVYPATPQDMAHHAKLMKELGVRIIGACCGSTPEHIEAMANELKK